jgi:D-aminoacyl-tRNA deacylase
MIFAGCAGHVYAPNNPIPNTMRAIIQRVKAGSVVVDGDLISQIRLGYVILVGIGHGDGHQSVLRMARKVQNLRVFEDEQGRMNLSILDIHGEALVVSQFTLYADTSGGNRPSFTNAAPPEMAKPLIEEFVSALRQQGIPTLTGIFGANMLVDIQNDGPVTIMLEE